MSPFVQGFVQEIKKDARWGAGWRKIISTSRVAPLQAKLNQAKNPSLFENVLGKSSPMEKPV